MTPTVTYVGVDGCKGGWIAVIDGQAGFTAQVFATFEHLVGSLADDALIAVDMPIGLPEATTHGGRGPEALVRRLLGARQSSVFSIPSRAAVYAETAPFSSLDAWYDAHRRASAVARQTSSPPRGVSIQAFGIFAKIREVDLLLRGQPQLMQRVFESHPEVAFWALNQNRAMQLPKKVKGSINPSGMEERVALLARCGVGLEFLGRRPPAGAASDDFLDAVAMCLVARRIGEAKAICFPDPPHRDAHGIPIAIRC